MPFHTVGSFLGFYFYCPRRCFLSFRIIHPILCKVLGSHELFIVQNIHHNKDLPWNEKRHLLG